MNQQLVQTIGVVLGVLLAIPLLTAIVYIAMFAATLRAGAGALKERMDEFTKIMNTFIARIDESMTSHGERLVVAEARLKILWDGHERRSGTERRLPSEEG